MIKEIIVNAEEIFFEITGMTIIQGLFFTGVMAIVLILFLKYVFIPFKIKKRFGEVEESE